MSTVGAERPELMLFAACVLPGCRAIVDEDGDACTECLDLWGPYICRVGEKPAWYPSGWVLRSDGVWGIPWGITADPEVRRAAAQAERQALADRIAVERDLRRIGFQDA